MQALFSLMVFAYLAGALSALVSGRGALRRQLPAAGAVIGAAAGIGLSLMVLVGQTPFAQVWPNVLPLAGGMSFRLDALGAF